MWSGTIARSDTPLCGLKGFESAYPKSSREACGNAWARACLAVEPEILFMDEPFSALDVLTPKPPSELMELWLGEDSDKSIFWSPTIEEAVLLADRIIVWDEIQPRSVRISVCPSNNLGSRLRRILLYVDYIYKLMTQPQLEAGLHPRTRRQDSLSHDPQPGAARSQDAGISEGPRRQEDCTASPRNFAWRSTIFCHRRSRALLAFAKSERGDVELTGAGEAFAGADIATANAVPRCCARPRHASAADQHCLLNKSDHTMPLEFFRDLCRTLSTTKFNSRSIRAQLGRYGDIFTYDSETDRLTLNQARQS